MVDVDVVVVVVDVDEVVAPVGIVWRLAGPQCPMLESPPLRRGREEKGRLCWRTTTRRSTRHQWSWQCNVI